MASFRYAVADETESHYRIHLQLWEMPRGSELERMTATFATILESDRRKAIFHIEHMKESIALVPPDMPSLLHIVSKLLEIRDDISRALAGTCLQAHEIDDPARQTLGFFESLYKPTRPFRVLVGEEHAKAFCASIVSELELQRSNANATGCVPSQAQSTVVSISSQKQSPIGLTISSQKQNARQ